MKEQKLSLLETSFGFWPPSLDLWLNGHLKMKLCEDIGTWSLQWWPSWTSWAPPCTHSRPHSGLSCLWTPPPLGGHHCGLVHQPTGTDSDQIGNGKDRDKLNSWVGVRTCIHTLYPILLVRPISSRTFLTFCSRTSFLNNKAYLLHS